VLDGDRPGSCARTHTGPMPGAGEETCLQLEVLGNEGHEELKHRRPPAPQDLYRCWPLARGWPE